MQYKGKKSMGEILSSSIAAGMVSFMLCVIPPVFYTTLNPPIMKEQRALRNDKEVKRYLQLRGLQFDTLTQPETAKEYQLLLSDSEVNRYGELDKQYADQVLPIKPLFTAAGMGVLGGTTTAIVMKRRRKGEK